jgi:hypothetical protein
VLIVDKAVYALQEMQPGLEKVFFTLQEELLKPQAQAVYKPSEKLDDIVRQPVVADTQQQIARVLMTAIKPKPPTQWEVNPVAERQRKMEEQIAAIGSALWWQWGMRDKPVLAKDGKTFQPGLLEELVKAKMLDANLLTDPVGGKLTLERLAELEKGFTPERFATALTVQRMQNLIWPLANSCQQRQAQWLKDGKWTIPETALAEAAKQQGVQASLKDAWGRPTKLVKRDKKRDQPFPWVPLQDYDLVSAGPDGKFGTADDVKLPSPDQWRVAHVWWLTDSSRLAPQAQFARRRILARRELLQLGAMEFEMAPSAAGARFAGGALAPLAAPQVDFLARAAPQKKADSRPQSAAGGDVAGGPAPPRLREYFPETLLWQPALITDENGRATLPIDFADSITTWRLTASASSRLGLLGGTSKPLRVFQDFFVDLDLPIALTQNDEVAFPVAVYNYLKGPQRVKLDLQPEPWFELVDGLGLSRSIDLKANEVTSVKFRIRAKNIGHFSLTVKASGTKMSDAIKRSLDVVPNGRMIEQVVTDRLAGTVTQTVSIPNNAIADASKLFVKIYPGVFSQILEGTEGMLRLPGG